MKIKVKSGYVGLNTQGNIIAPGVYEVGHEHLYGCEAEMIEIGRAEYVDDDYVEAVDVLPAPIVTSDTDPLGGFDVKELPAEVVAAALSAAIEPQPIEIEDETSEAEGNDGPVQPRKRGRK